jgi:hypothetical protein
MFVDEHYPEEVIPIKNIGKRQEKLYSPEYQAPPICKIELITQWHLRCKNRKDLKIQTFFIKCALLEFFKRRVFYKCSVL